VGYGLGLFLGEPSADPLVPRDAAGYDSGTIYPDRDLCRPGTQSDFDNWVAATSVPELGGTPYGCPGGFPCDPYASAYLQLGLGTIAKSGMFGPSNVVRLRVGAAMMQWFWVCVELRYKSGVLRSEVNTSISFTAARGADVLFAATSTVSAAPARKFGNTPTQGTTFSGRCRWTSGQPIDLEFQRRDVRETLNLEEAGPAASLGVSVYGRLGRVTA
jgi:hypothetical protein